MSSRTFVAIPRKIFDQISHWSEQAYPNEGCGLLLGRFFPTGGKEAARFSPLTNVLLHRSLAKGSSTGPETFSTLPPERQGIGAGKTEFVINPEEFNREALAAEREGLDIIGILHTHPDHPPRPSQIDASQPFLAQWSNIIVAVHQGRLKEMKSWFRETDDEPFEEERIDIR